jgi:hypothetical protein
MSSVCHFGNRRELKEKAAGDEREFIPSNYHVQIRGSEAVPDAVGGEQVTGPLN